MFTTKGLFFNVICPYLDTCVLPQCIFKHSEALQISAQSLVSEEAEVEQNYDQEGQRKKLKLDNGIVNTSLPVSDASVRNSNPLAANTKTLPPSSLNSKPRRDAKSPKQSFAATRPISPPPLRRKSQPSTLVQNKQPHSSFGSVAVPKPANKAALVKKPVKAPLKTEGLNPRALKVPAPASHEMRFKLLRALHDHFVRLNKEAAKMATNKEEGLVLSEQALITKALDIEYEAVFKPSIYSNIVKNKILYYKRMTVTQWIEERHEEMAKEKALEVATAPSTAPTKPLTPPKPFETELSLQEELALVHRLHTPVNFPDHGYVTTTPTANEIELAKQGVEAAQGWEVCDRCQSRFQVFPERREEDGAVASGGPCKHHFGRAYLTERPAGNPKAKRDKKYRCCGELVAESSGCAEAENHVFKITEMKRMAAVLNFEHTPANPEKVSGQPVCIDGEMGYTVYGLELIRLTATSWPSGSEIFDVLVKPMGLILDLNSRYSGVWPKDMAEAQPYSPSVPEIKDGAPRKLQIVQSPAAARALLFSHLAPSTPLIGHGLENDLNAIRMIHPTIIDTALLFPHKNGLPYRYGLKYLMETYLHRQIQVVLDGVMTGHDSKEDANAAGDLVRYALANEWKKMKREGWVIENGEFKPPVKKEGLSVGFLEMTPIKIPSGIGRKRSRDEVDDEVKVKNLARKVKS